MIRRFFSSVFPPIQADKTQVAAASGSLLFGLIAVLLASAFMQTEPWRDALPKDADRIFKVNKWIEKPGEERLPSIKTPGLMAPALATGMPEVEAAARIMIWPEAVTLGNMGRNFTTNRWSFADPAFLQVFKPEFIQGNAATALNKPGQIVLTEAAARKLFGSVHIVGQSLMGLGGKIYTVSGVVKNPTPQSAVQFDLLASWASTEKNSGFHDFRFMNNWIGQTVETYLLLRNADQQATAESRLGNVIQKVTPGQPGQYAFFLQPVIQPGQKSGTVGTSSLGKFSSHLLAPLSGTMLMSVIPAS
ncbi:MAG: ABC transporter permease [Thermoanaerobaculia bacterium]|nr:ABC transporter permease [Thermoanaerobaculia bacterium]